MHVTEYSFVKNWQLLFSCKQPHILTRVSLSHTHRDYSPYCTYHLTEGSFRLCTMMHKLTLTHTHTSCIAIFIRAFYFISTTLSVKIMFCYTQKKYLFYYPCEDLLLTSLLMQPIKAMPPPKPYPNIKLF